MPRRYPVEFRTKVLDLVEAGRPVAEVAAQLGVTAQTIYNWRNQDQIDRNVRPGLRVCRGIFEYLEIFHNRQRRHSSLGMLTPIEYERRHSPTARDQAS